MLKRFILFIFIPLFFCQGQIRPVRIHYAGGGDWYGNKTTWRNILSLAAQTLHMDVAPKEYAAKILDPAFRESPIAYIAGHGNIRFSEAEAKALRAWLINGGFLFADDDYGMDKSFRRQMAKVFPELKFVELPFNHPIYHVYYQFPQGLPKVHEHAGGPPHGLALIYKGRVVCFYSFNTDISDGCEDIEIHHDPQAVRIRALRMALNILVYALEN